MTTDIQTARATESKVPLVKGTADLHPANYARLQRLEALLLDRFGRSGYHPIRVPVLENRTLHERKSGARILASLYQVSGGLSEEVCLRPELTAGIVRAFNASPVPATLPWRVSYSGPVFRILPTGPGVLREFQHVGVERLDTIGNGGDAEAIWLADWSLSQAGISDATIRIGHAGLIRDLLKWSGLPLGVQVALVEVLGDAAQAESDVHACDRVLSAMEAHLESLATWLGSGAAKADEQVVNQDDPGVDRLFRTLYPEVVGRRSGRDVIGRIRRKWELGRGVSEVLAKLRDRVHELADLRGPAVEVLERLKRYEDVVPAMAGELRGLVNSLVAYGIDPARIELDLGFGRGLGFYSQMMFVLLAETPDGPLEVCGGGRYDGLARALGASSEIGGVGFAFGLERLCEVLDARNVSPAEIETTATILLLSNGTEGYSTATWLRSAGQALVVESAPVSGSDKDLARIAATRGFGLVLRTAESSKYRLLQTKSGVETIVSSRDELLRLLIQAGARS